MTTDVSQSKRVRGAIVDMLYVRHQMQQSRVDHVQLWHMLRDIGHDIGENDAITQVQDLGDRGYLTFTSTRNRFTNRTSITLIQLTARGRDLKEETIVDPAVQF